MTCKDCIHYDVCDVYQANVVDKTSPRLCGCFKPKSRYIELPCAVGDKFWLLNLNKEQNRILEIDPICEAVVDRIEILRDNVERIILRLQSKHLCMKIRGIEDFGKTVFLTKEEAVKALEERSEGK